LLTSESQEHDLTLETRDKRPSEKALKILGRDASKEKLMNTLGIESEQLKLVELELIERAEEQLKREREIEGSCKNKRDTQKARDILGYDPSKQKVMNKLGIDESAVNDAIQENIIREEEEYRKKRKNSASMDKKHALKALNTLGVDPSLQKVMDTLGMDDMDLATVEQGKIEDYEEECERQRRNSWADKRHASKALRVLGIDPSREKLESTLGLDDQEFEEAQLEEYTRHEEKIKKLRMNDVKANKKLNSKALRVLGHDPSENILNAKYGVDENTLQSQFPASARKSPRGPPVSFGALRAVGVGIVAIIVYYLFFHNLVQ